MRGLLIDENLPPELADAIHSRDPILAVRGVGDGIAPPRGTLDPQLLVWIEENDFLLVTNNRGSMPIHLSHHLADGRHVPGILQVPKRKVTMGSVADEIVLHCGATLPGELQDRITYLNPT